MKKTIFSGLLASALLASGSYAATSSLYWNFTDNNGVFDTGTASDFTIGAFAPGNSKGTLTAQGTPVSANMPFNNSSASSGYTGASGTGNMGNAVKIGAYSSATSSYFSITVTPTAGFQISLDDFDFGARSTGTGATTFALYSSADSFTAAVFTGSIATTGTWALKNNTFTSYTFTTATEFRLYTFGGAGAPADGTVNTRVDDVTINFSSTAVPEPHEYGIALAGLLAVVVILRRRQGARASA